MNKESLEEEILKGWLNATSEIQNNRIVQGMTFNEALICNNLWYQSKKEPSYLTPKELCALTGISKSLMNRTLKALLEKHMIEYADWDGDRRSTPVRLNPKKADEFLEVHNHSLSVVCALTKIWGKEKSERIAASLKDICEGFHEIFLSKNE